MPSRYWPTEARIVTRRCSRRSGSISRSVSSDTDPPRGRPTRHHTPAPDKRGENQASGDHRTGLPSLRDRLPLATTHHGLRVLVAGFRAAESPRRIPVCLRRDSPPRRVSDHLGSLRSAVRDGRGRTKAWRSSWAAQPDAQRFPWAQARNRLRAAGVVRMRRSRCSAACSVPERLNVHPSVHRRLAIRNVGNSASVASGSEPRRR